MTQLLADLYRQGKPLVEITISLKDGQLFEEVKEILNSLGADIWVDHSPYNQYLEISEISKRRLSGQATREALLRIFGWSLVRVEIPDYPGYYHWEQCNRPQFYPPQLEGKIDFIGFSEPGSADTGNADLVEYSLNK